MDYILKVQSLFFLGIGLLGLLVGSFLNVVIVRLPRMLLSAEESSPILALNLLSPPSHCPHCLHPIRWFDNIPLLSFLWLKGRCRHCVQPISIRYPLVELLSALLSILVGVSFGMLPITGVALLLVWALIALTFIDLEYTLLPDHITLPFIWLGLLINIFEAFTTPTSAILGAITGYLVLWVVYWVFKWVTHKEGIGFGDFKLLAMLGAWLGWQALPLIILLSSLLGTLIGLYLICVGGKTKNTPIPFGPFLAIAGYIALLWGPVINRLYAQFLIL